MSRWIDAEWLMKYFKRGEEYKGEYVLDDLKYDAPTIDIVPCKECRYWGGCKSTLHNKHLCRRAENVDYWTTADDFCSYGERRDSEKPNNCEHITEDGVTCAKYPACDDCPDNPLNKVKGSERLVKGSEKPNYSEIPTGSERSSE